MLRRTLLRSGALAPALLISPRVRAQGTGGAPVKIGVLTDETGPYADSAGPGSVLAARFAAQDVPETPAVILHADTQNKPDVASAIARQWFDSEGVDAIVDLPVTPVALAVQQLAEAKSRTVMITASAISEFTSKYCAPVSTHWADDTHALAAGTASAVLADGGDTWFFITVDMSFGTGLQAAATEVITAGGGRVLGSVKHAIGATDYSSQLLAAQASGAKVIGLASVGGDLVNLLKQASEFGVTRGGRQRLAGFLIYIDDINALGLQTAQGFTFPANFYWDQNPQSRAFATRFLGLQNLMPSNNQAEVYAAVAHYLRAVAAAGTRDAVAVGRAMRAGTFDYFGHPARVREDGRVMFDLTLYRVKSPDQSRYAWDYYQPVRVIPAEQAFLPANPACKA
jgi:branched-chain amino acid transport system substrate-binding protein